MQRVLAKSLLTLAAAALFAACGGSEPEGGLTVEFEYPDSVQLELFDDISVAPSKLNGMQGQSWKIELSAQDGPLPHGMTFSTSDHAIGGYAGAAGTPTQAGVSTAWVKATVTRGTKTAKLGSHSYVYMNVQ